MGKKIVILEKNLTLSIRLENILEKCVFKVKNFAVSEVKGFKCQIRKSAYRVLQSPKRQIRKFAYLKAATLQQASSCHCWA